MNTDLSKLLKNCARSLLIGVGAGALAPSAKVAVIAAACLGVAAIIGDEL